MWQSLSTILVELCEVDVAQLVRILVVDSIHPGLSTTLHTSALIYY